ncbi:MAG: hypothetical protein ACLFU7_07975 [Armatimonadota bacterium]
MRSRFAHVAVFIGVFCLFYGYCEWWKSRPQAVALAIGQTSPGRGAYLVEGAADETFNGAYVPAAQHHGRQYFMKQEPRRFLWRSDTRWHLSTEPGMLADGYMCEPGRSPCAQWQMDGSPEPAPRVSSIPEFVDEPDPGGSRAGRAGAPSHLDPANLVDTPATSPG